MSYKLIIFLFFTFSDIYCNEYNPEIYYIAPRSSRIIVETTDTQYYALNVGIPKVTVQILYGNDRNWLGALQERQLFHGETYTFNLVKRYMYMAIKVINNEDKIGYVHAFATSRNYPEFDDRETKYFNLDKEGLIKTIVGAGVAYVPIVGEVLDGLVDFFWPSEEVNVWEDVKDKVADMMDSKTQTALEGILSGVMENIRLRMQVCIYEIKHPNITKTTGNHYVNIMEDLLGLERRFEFKNENSVNTNFFLLPLYSSVIDLKLSFYQFGIKNQKLINLNDEHIVRIKYYISELIYNVKIGAIVHVNNVCQKKFDFDYSETYSTILFNQLANMRAYCALNGYEHIPLWKAIARNPYLTHKPEIPVLVYSTYFGRATASETSDMILPNGLPMEIKIYNDKLDVLSEIQVFYTRDNRIGGLRLEYSRSSIYLGPTITGKPTTIEFKGKKLMNLTARGTGQIDALEFEFEDGRVVKTGTPGGDSRTFSLEKHHIVGMHMTNSLQRVNRDQAANIFVIYQAITDK